MPENATHNWLSRLNKSLQQTRDEPESRYFQLATCDEEGMPQNRTLVFRSLDKNDYSITVISDLRTAKIDALRHSPYGEICWYFSRTREQYRLAVRGDVVDIETDAPRVQYYWRKMSEAGKKQFLWGKPGTPREPGQSLKNAEDSREVPSHFCLLKLNVLSVDYLSLRASPQYREVCQRKSDNTWHCQSVIP